MGISTFSFYQFRGGVQVFTLIGVVVVGAGTVLVFPGPEDGLTLTLCGVLPDGISAVLVDVLTDAVGELPDIVLGPLSLTMPEFFVMETFLITICLPLYWLGLPAKSS